MRAFCAPWWPRSAVRPPQAGWPLADVCAEVQTRVAAGENLAQFFNQADMIHPVIRHDMARDWRGDIDFPGDEYGGAIRAVFQR